MIEEFFLNNPPDYWYWVIKNEKEQIIQSNISFLLLIDCIEDFEKREIKLQENEKAFYVPQWNTLPDYMRDYLNEQTRNYQ